MSKKPNVILIFTDNQQASTLACYGNPEVHTPNLDHLAASGIRFDNAFCPNTFCSPCRASVLTGTLPSQHGVHSWIDDRKSQDWPKGWHALEGTRTLPRILKDDGYNTALIGKYHLGDPTTPADGFDHWVTLEDGHVRSFYRNRIFDNGTSYDQTGHSVDFFTGKAQKFIASSAEDDQPFFLFLPYPAPYGHWPATKETDENRHTKRYENCPMDSIPRTALSKQATDGFLMNQSGSTADLDFSMLMRAPNDLPTLRNYYSQISMVDDGVGEIMKTLKENELEKDTLIIYTADHGLSVGQHGFWGHGGASFPSNMHKAAHSVPLIVSQKGLISENSTSDLMVSNMDLYSTIINYAGIQTTENEATPSRNLLPTIKGARSSDWGPDVVFSEQEETRVIRTKQWVLFKRFDGPENLGITDQLYNVEKDPEEAQNLSGEQEYAEIEAELNEKLAVFFRKYAKPEADLWSGGQPIQNSIRHGFWQKIWGENWNPVYSYK